MSVSSCRARAEVAQGCLARFHRDLNEVIVDRFFIGAPVQSMSDPLDQACVERLLKPAPRHAVEFSLGGRERSWEFWFRDPGHLLGDVPNAIQV